MSISMNIERLLPCLAVTVIAIGIAISIAIPSKPQVVVNMPTDAKPLTQLAEHPTVIANDKAILWWTVYKATLDSGRVNSTYCVDAATQAVTAAYGH